MRLGLRTTLVLVLMLLAVNAYAVAVNLGTAGSFGVLAGSGVTNSGSSVIKGDVGSSPTPSVTGFPPGTVIGTVYTTANAVTAQAQSDLTAAYLVAAGAPCPATHNLTGINLGTFNAGNPLLAGVYCFSSSAALTGNLTLDGQGNPNSQWIFQIGSSLTTATNATVSFVNGASPCNVFWQVGSSATIQTNNLFGGTIMALTSITLNGGTLNGRALARNGVVTISAAEFVNTACPAPTAPCVTIAKTADRAVAAVGDVVTYTYVICNCALATETVNSVVDSQLGNITAGFVTANGGVSTLASGACRSFTRTRMVLATDTSPLVNSVVVDVSIGAAHTTDTAQASVIISAPGPCVTLVKTVNRTVASVGDFVTYTFKVCNCGTAPLTVNSVVDSRLGNLTADFIAANGGSSTLGTGLCTSFDEVYRVKATDPSPLTNTATVSASSGGTTVTSTGQATVVITSGPCVTITKQANRTQASVGDTIVYTYTVCNCGTAPLTLGSVIDSRLGDLTADFMAANAGSSTLVPAQCVTFTRSYIVKATDVSPLVNSVTVTAQSGTTTVTSTSEVVVVIVGAVLNQAVGVDVGGVFAALPGILQIIPQGPGETPWANFIPAARDNVPYTIKNVLFTKTAPTFVQCAPFFPPHTVTQHGTPNIRLWWPLMYEAPGTTFTLNILYGTPKLYDDDGPGPHTPAWVHTAQFTWTVQASLDSLSTLLALFHELPFGRDEVPLISDEPLYTALQLKIAAAIAADQAHDTATVAAILADFELEVMDACIDTSPSFPNPTGLGTGIANTEENPACCKLLVDVEFILKTTGIGVPAK
jgi:hypothetical protein